MTTFSEKQVFYAYVDKDGKVASWIYDGQGPATKDMVDRVMRQDNWYRETLGPYPAHGDFKSYSEYQKAYKEHDKAVRKEAKKRISELGFKLQTFALVRQ